MSSTLKERGSAESFNVLKGSVFNSMAEPPKMVLDKKSVTEC
jgi:hypothetical protein